MRSQTGGTLPRGLGEHHQDRAAQGQSSVESQQHRLRCFKTKVEELKTVKVVHHSLRKTEGEKEEHCKIKKK